VSAWGSVNVDARRSVTVETWESAIVRDQGAAEVRPWGHSVVVSRRSGKAEQARHGRPRSAEQWCELNGVEASDGVAVLFKAVDAEFRSDHGLSYAPGTRPAAPDWDATDECGGGLHLVARPFHALEYALQPRRYVACPVRLEDVALVRPAHGTKVKARRACAPAYEVSEEGDPL
jgi:hypothetical protein